MNKLHLVIPSIFLIVAGRFVFAGSLEPSAPPASTMRSLNEVLPSWNQKLDSDERFELALGTDAVLDKETGLVWERTPSTIPRTWTTAMESCYKRGTGGRAGWHLPTTPEMASLFDWGAALPLTSSPLFNVSDLNGCTGTFCQFWTATTTLYDTTQAYSVRIEVSSDSWDAARPELKTTSHRVWCVRGGSGHAWQ